MATKRIGNITLNYTVPEAQTQVYNAIGRTAGNQAATQQNTNQGGGDNFFTKRGRSIENAVGTTLAAPIEAIRSGGFIAKGTENIATEKLLKDSKRSMNDIAKKFGYNSWSDWQDAYEEARNANDTEKIKQFKTQNKEFQAQANANAAKADKKAADYEDYRNNNYISKKINQDNTKYLGSAINTLSTAADLTGITSTPGLNAIQGGIEGFADEMEQNGGNIDITRPFSQGIKITGGDNFSWERAGQNALVGATTGAVTGALNKSISKAIAPTSAVKGVTKGGFSAALKNGMKTVGEGAARGALSGAVGGATGAGLQTAINSVKNGADFWQGAQDTLQSALQGAGQGAWQGATTGAVMAGANAAARKIPGVGNVLTQIDEANKDWATRKANGESFNERLTNTLTSGDSAVGDWLMNKRQSNVLGAAGNLGNRVQFIDDEFNLESIPGMSKNLREYLDNTPRTPEYMEKEIEHARQYVDEYNNAADKSKTNFGYLSESPDGTKMVEAMRELAANGDTIMAEIGGNTQQTPTTAKGWAKKAGQRIVEDVNNSNLGNRVKDVSSDMPEDIRNMQIRDYNANADGGIDTTYGIASDPRVRQQLLANVNAQLAENPNARIGDTNFDADAIISEYSERLTPEQYRNFNPTDAENALVQELQGLEASQGFTRPNSRQITQTTQVDPWDRVAQEAGYSNYDEVLQRYAEANPNAKINPRGMAGQVLTWMDQNPNTPTTAAGWAKRAGQRAVEDVNNSNLGLRVQDVSQDDPSKRLYNALVGNQEPVATAKANTLPEADMGIEEATAKTSKAGKLRNAAGLKYAAQYGTIDKPTAKATNPAKTFTELAELGFTKPADVERMAGAMTGSNGEMSALVRNVVNASDPVDTFAGEKSGQTLDDYINLSIQKHGLDGIREGKAVKSQIDALMGSLPSHAEGSIDFQDTPEAVFKLTQQLDAEAANYRGKSGMNYGTTTPDKLRAAQVISDVSGLLKDRIYSNSDVKQALTPEVAQNLKSYAPNNKAWAKYVDDTVMNMENVKDLRSAQANWVNANKIIDNAYVNSMTYGGRVGGSGSIPLTKRGLAGAILDKTINSDTGLRTQAKLLNKAADFVDKNPDTNATTNPDTAAGWAKQAGKRAAEDLGNTNLGNRIQDVSGQPVNPQVATPAELANSVADYNPSTQLYNAIGRTEGALAQETPAQYLANAAQEAEIVPSMEMPVSSQTATIAETPTYGSTQLYNTVAGTPSATTQTTSTGTMGYFEPTGDYWTDVLARAISSAIDANDVDAFASLYDMYQDAIAQTSKQSSEKDYTNPTNWSSSDRNKLLTAQNGLDQISQLEQAYKDATGEGGSNAIQGWLRSRASDISGGNLDPSASNYNALTDSVGLAIIKNLINLGVTTEDAERYKKYIPAITDTKEQAAEKLATLRSIYQNQINNLYSVYGV